MAKKPAPTSGKMRDKLKENTSHDARKIVETVLNQAPDDSAHEAIKAAIDPGDSVVLDDKPVTINKAEAEVLARRFSDKKKEDTMAADEAIKFAKSRNAELKEIKKQRKQQNPRIISQLRATDPLGKKTCKRCAHRVDIINMDTEQELCEICAS